MLTTRRSLVALVAICGALVLNAFVLSPLWILAPAEAFSDTVAVAAFPWSQRISWLLLTLLIPVVPAVLRAGSRGTPPAWVGPLVQITLAAQAATHFVQGFVMAWLLPLAPEVIDLTTDGGALQIALFTIWLSFLVVNVLFAVTLWRAGHSRVGAGLMMVGAVVTPMFGPFGAGLLALGLTVIAVGALRSRTAAPERVLSPTTL